MENTTSTSSKTPSTSEEKVSITPEKTPRPQLRPSSPKSKLPIIIATLIGLVMLAVIGAVGYYVVTTQSSSEPAPTPSPTATCTEETQVCPDGTYVVRVAPSCEFAECPAVATESVTTALKGWKTTKTADFEISYPENFTVNDDPENKAVNVHIFGPTQKEGTELYDGLSMTFGLIPLEGQSLDQVVDQARSQSQEVNATTEAKNPITYGKYHGFSFKMTGLGTFTQYYLQKDANSDSAVYVITAAYDPGNQGYLKLEQQILKNLVIFK